MRTAWIACLIALAALAAPAKAADWDGPVLTDNYVDFLGKLKGRDLDAAVLFDPAHVTPSNVPEGAVRWNSAATRIEQWDGDAWEPLILSNTIDGQAAIEGGSIDGVTIGGTTPADGAFANVFSESDLTVEGNAYFAGAILHEGACESGYVRVGVGFCMNPGAVRRSLASLDCELIIAPENAKAVLLIVDISVGRHETFETGLRTGTLSSFGDDECSGSSHNLMQLSVYQYDTTALPSTPLISHRGHAITPAGRYIGLTFAGGAPVNGGYQVLGYWD